MPTFLCTGMALDLVLFVVECQILDSHPGMAFAKWLASLDEEPFSFEVLFA